MVQPQILQEIPESSSWTEIKPISKGWSLDTKFLVKNAANERFLVRISDNTSFEERKQEFESKKNLPVYHLNITQPVRFGLTKSREKIYTIYTWVEGIDVEQEITKLSPKLQYECGREAGGILRQIHAVSAPEKQDSWPLRFQAKVEDRIRQYEADPVSLDYGDKVIQFLRDNMHHLHNRPQTLQHGDYHLGNMVLDKVSNQNKTRGSFSSSYKLGIIDFGQLSYGDPWEEFERCFFIIQKSIPFMNGQIHGYFQDKIPDNFLRLMMFYTGYSCIASIPWTRNSGPEEVEKMRILANKVIKSFDNFNSFIPVWYLPPDKVKYGDI